jgi:dihydrodipicolinate synthase/N-acetylneuraminate lyase
MLHDPLEGRRSEVLFPRLWCPLLTHYDAGGALDLARMRAHLSHIRPHVNAFLVPGSTGDGWLLSDAEARAVLAFLLDVIDQEPSDHALVMVGALKATLEDACRVITETVDWLQERTGASDAAEALRRAHVAGFTVCPPTGAHLSPAAIEEGLSQILALGLPTALYQLPQVTHNEMSPEMVARLAARFENLILFKDSSGTDTVALAGLDLGRVFLVRGAEGDYGKWLKGSGGPYDGYLLSTANCFASELRTIVDASASGNSRDPDLVQLAESVSGCVADAFAAVSGVNAPGNAFTYANKALDHFMANGPNAPLDADALPILHGGTRLPQSVVATVGGALARWRRMPDDGYLQNL